MGYGMTLPAGCRIVCRKNRSTPRITKIADVVRMAKAAVKNGDAPCDITHAVGDAIGCSRRDCSEHVEPIITLLGDMDTALDELLDALMDIARTLSGGAMDVYEELQGAVTNEEELSGMERVKRAIKRLVNRVGIMFSVADIYQAIARIYSAMDILYSTYRALEGKIIALTKCVEEET